MENFGLQTSLSAAIETQKHVNTSMSISFANKEVVTKQKSDFSVQPEPPSPKQSTPLLRKESSTKLIDSAVKSEQ